MTDQAKLHRLKSDRHQISESCLSSTTKTIFDNHESIYVQCRQKENDSEYSWIVVNSNKSSESAFDLLHRYGYTYTTTIEQDVTNGTFAGSNYDGIVLVTGLGSVSIQNNQWVFEPLKNVFRCWIVGWVFQTLKNYQLRVTSLEIWLLCQSERWKSDISSISCKAQESRVTNLPSEFKILMICTNLESFLERGSLWVDLEMNPA